MKRMIWLLMLTSNFIFSQNNNVALMHAEGYPKLDNTETVAMAITSFELVGGLVVVKASVDGQEGDFVLDTGAPNVVLNTDEIQNSEIEATGINGQIEIGEVDVNEFKWGMIKMSDFKGLTLDISHLEEACERNLMGLIGFEVLQNYELLFDYKNRIIRMYDAKNASDFRPEGYQLELPFRFNGHIPVIAAKIGNKRTYLGLDSGAEINLLDESFYSKLKKHQLTNVEKEHVRGLDKKRKTVFSGEVDETEIKKASYEKLRFLFLDLSEVTTDSEMNGVLGFPFFAEHTISINYRKKKVYIWK